LTKTHKKKRHSSGFNNANRPEVCAFFKISRAKKKNRAQKQEVENGNLGF
jgi:hypothetical protein